MSIAIIAVGSELLLGQIANTNGQFLSKVFNEIGQNVLEHKVIGITKMFRIKCTSCVRKI